MTDGTKKVKQKVETRMYEAMRRKGQPTCADELAQELGIATNTARADMCYMSKKGMVQYTGQRVTSPVTGTKQREYMLVDAPADNPDITPDDDDEDFHPQLD